MMDFESDYIRVLVCGGRDFNDYEAVKGFLDRLTIGQIIYGGARGADALGKRYADEHHIGSTCFRADWSKHGRIAGPLRNQQMLDEGKPDIVVAFKGGRGTADMVRRAVNAGVQVAEVIE